MKAEKIFFPILMDLRSIGSMVSCNLMIKIYFNGWHKKEQRGMSGLNQYSAYYISADKIMISPTIGTNWQQKKVT